MKLTLEELNEFTVDEFLKYANIWTEDYKKANGYHDSETATRKATQSDIDKQFFM